MKHFFKIFLIAFVIAMILAYIVQVTAGMQIANIPVVGGIYNWLYSITNPNGQSQTGA